MPISSALGSAALLPAGLGFRNKIINGDMRIAQRGTAAISGTGGQQFPVDRWCVLHSSGVSGINFQQSTVAPAGFTNSLLATVVGAGSSNYTKIIQYIEGSNVSDLSWGNSGGKPITVSFWVRSSIIGTYTCSVINSAIDRTYISPFTINVANTWEYKTLFIPADTAGTWLTTNGRGLGLEINLGTSIGALAGTPYVWSSNAAFSVTGAVNLTSNAGATFYLTGVQLEQNYQPTPFEQRPIGAELALCQRYYEKSYNVNVAPGTSTDAGAFYGDFTTHADNTSVSPLFFKVTKRIPPPTITYYRTNGTLGSWDYARNGASGTVAPVNFAVGESIIMNYVSLGVAWVPALRWGHWTADAEL